MHYLRIRISPNINQGVEAARPVFVSSKCQTFGSRSGTQNVGTDLDPISLSKLVRLTQHHIGIYRFVYDKTMFHISPFQRVFCFVSKRLLIRDRPYFHACLLNRGLIKDKTAKPADLR